jgi:hypothetical protein
MAGLLRKAFTENVANAWWGKLFLSFTFFLGAFAIYQILADVEKRGGGINIAVALVYRLTGKIGAAAIFGVLPGFIFAFLAFRQWRSQRAGLGPLRMTTSLCARIPEWLQARQITAEPVVHLQEFDVLKCERAGAVVLLFLTNERETSGGDTGSDQVIVTASGGHLLRFWNIPRNNKLRAEIVESLANLSRQGVAVSSG